MSDYCGDWRIQAQLLGVKNPSYRILELGPILSEELKALNLSWSVEDDLSEGEFYSLLTIARAGVIRNLKSICVCGLEDLEFRPENGAGWVQDELGKILIALNELDVCVRDRWS